LESSGAFSSQDIYGFIGPVDEICELDGEIWPLYRDLLTSEEGYLRYDFDEEHEDADVHPLHHLDVFFSSNVTFKLGLAEGVDFEKMADMLDSATDCHYVASAKQSGRVLRPKKAIEK
jgi:hypothetical protein